jgi:hypothetical protein
VKKSHAEIPIYNFLVRDVTLGASSVEVKGCFILKEAKMLIIDKSCREHFTVQSEGWYDFFQFIENQNIS